MSRSLPTGFGTLTDQPVFRPVFLVELQWVSGTIRFWNGYGNISWGGNVFTGTGHLGGISSLGETSDLSANGVTLSLSGIPTSLILNALEDDSQGRPGKVWIAGMDATGAFGADPYLIFDGFISTCPMEENGDTSTIQVKLEKELIDRRLNNRRYTHEDQQIDYPGDLIFKFVAGLWDKEVTWGGKTASSQGLSPGAVYPTGVGMVQFE